MKVSEMLANIQELTNTSITDGVLITWINALEQEYFKEIIEEYRTKWIEVKAGDKDIVLDVFKYEIKNLSIYDKVEGSSIATYDFIDSSLNLDIFSDTDNQGEGYAIKNKWGKCAVKVVYRYVPQLKTLDTADTDDLEILRYGSQWINLYEYHLKHKIFENEEEYNQANNMAIFYNDKKSDFLMYVAKHRYNRQVKEVESRW